MISAGASGAMWALSENVLPESSRKSYRLLDQIKGRTTPRGLTTDRHWILGKWMSAVAVAKILLLGSAL